MSELIEDQLDQLLRGLINDALIKRVKAIIVEAVQELDGLESVNVERIVKIPYRGS